MTVKSTLYIKNVLKSVSYATSDVFEDIAPNFNEFKETNADFYKATYAALKNPSLLFKKSVEAIQTSKVYQALDYGAKNLVEDLKTGNYYNKARKDQDELRLAGMDLSDWDDLSEFGVDNDWESKDTTTDDTITTGDKKIVDSIEGSNAAVANATVNAVINASNNQIKAGRADTSMLYAQNQALFGSIHKDITILGSTMDNIYKLQAASLENIDKNMTTFFTSETKLSAERNSILKEILELQRTVNKSAVDKEKQTKTAKSKSRIKWSDISIGGVPDIDSYFNAIKTNISKEIANMGISGFSEDSNMLATFMVSPIAGTMTYVMKGLIPSTIKAAMSELDSTISGVFGNIIGELGNHRDKDGLLGKLAKYLGINTGVNRSIDPSKYEKGAIPFDGITRKAITEVIPTHLRRIEAALTGNPEAIYDFKSGRWTNVNDVKKIYKSIKTNAINTATSDIKADMQKGISSVKNGMSSKTDIESFEKAVEEFFEYLYENNGRFNPNVSAQKNGIDYKYPNLLKHYPKIKQIYNKMDYIEQRDANGKITKSRNYKLSTKMQLSNKVLSSKDSENASYRNIEIDPTNVLSNLFTGIKSDSHGLWKKDGKFKANNLFDLNNSKDNLGNTIFDYLQNINKELIYLNTYGGGFGGSLKSGKRYSKNTNLDKLREERYSKISLNSKNISNTWKNEVTEQQRLESEVKKKIKSGEAIDIRDYNVDEEAYLDVLGEKTSESAAEAYNEILKSYGINSITAKVDKIVGEDVKSNKNIKKSTEEAVESNDDNSNKKEKIFFKKWFDNFMSGQTFTSGLIAASAESFTNLLYTADRAIYDMMYKSEIINDDGGDKTKYNGFLDAMVHKMSNKFKDIGKMFSEQIIDPFKEKLGIGDDFKNKFKSSMKDMGSKAWQSFKSANKSVYGPAYHEAMVALGLQQGETKAQQERIKRRKEALNDMDLVNKTTNFYDNDFLKLLEKNKLNYLDYDNIDEAKKAVKSSINKTMFNESNNLKDIIKNKELQMIIDYIKSDDFNEKDLEKINKNFNFKLKGSNINQIKQNFINDLLNYRIDKRDNDLRRMRSEYLYSDKFKFSGFIKDRNNEYLNEINFSGSIKEKQDKLNELLIRYGKKPISQDKLDKYYNTDEVLNKAYTRTIQSHNARGTISKPFSGLTTLTKGEGLLNSTGFSRVPKTGVYNVTEPTHIINTEDMYSMVGGTRVSVQQALGKEKLAAKAAGFKLKSNADGTLKINNEMKPEEIIAEAKKYVPEAAAGGLVGGILSLVLGLAGGPIVGGALGAGASIIKNSDILKDKLFGKANNKGARQGGIIPKKLLDKIHKYAPDMVKYGLAGIIPGLVTPLGLVGGILAGGAVGILSNNEKFTNKYFGEGGKLQFNSKEKEIVSKLLPGALKGAGVGAVIGTLVGGPFGLLGNATLGSALGMMGTTEEFKESILGKEINGKRYGGLMGTIKNIFSPVTNAFKKIASDAVRIFDEGFIDPISRFVKPTIYALPKALGFLPRQLNRLLNRQKKLNNPIARGLAKFAQVPLNIFGKVVPGFARGAMQIASAPTRFLGRVGDFETKKMINTMNAEHMTADQRINFIRDHGGEISKFDESLQKIGTKDGMTLDQAKKASETIASMIGAKSATQEKRNESYKELKFIIDGLNKDGKKIKIGAIKRAIDRNDPTEIRRLLQDGGMKYDEIENFMSGSNGSNGFESKMAKYLKYNNSLSSIKKLSKEEQNEEFKKLSKTSKELLGIDLAKADNHTLKKVLKYLNTEILDQEAGNAKADPIKKANEEYRDHITESFDTLNNTTKNVLDLLIAISRGDTDALKAEAEKVQESIKKGKVIQDEDYLNKAEANEEAMGKEEYSKISNETMDNLVAGTKKKIFKRNGVTSYKNKFISRMKKSKYGAKIYELLKGENEDNIYKIHKWGGTLAEDAIEYASNLNYLEMKNLHKYFKIARYDHYAESITKLKITKKDLEFMVNNDPKTIMNKISTVFANYPNKSFKSIIEVCDFFDKYKIISDRKTDIDEEDEEETTVDSNGIGTMLLRGAGKVAKGLIKGVGAIGKGSKKLFSLFKNKKDNKEYKDKVLEATTGSTAITDALSQSKIGDNNNLDEVDKAGDGKNSQHVGGGKFITVERNSSGEVQPDTSDANTKAVLNELNFKDKMLLKVQEAQLKAAEIIKANFDTSHIKESKGGKFGWLSMLLLGGLLWKSGILKKLYEGFIKPIWTEKIHPWIKNTAIPWITDTAIPKIGDIFSKVLKTTLPIAGEVIGNSIVGAIEMLPELFIAAIKGAGSVLDIFSKNKYNAGESNTLDNDYLKELGNTETKMYDENGNLLTGNDILNHNYKQIYNADGTKGTIDKDGNITFKDPSKKGMSYLSTIVNGASHGFAKSLSNGKVGILTKGTSGIFKFMRRHGGLISKIAGSAGGAMIEPIKAAENFGVKSNHIFNNFINNKVDNIVENMLNNQNLTGKERELAKIKLQNGDGSKLSNFINKIFKKNNEKAINKNSGKISKLFENLKNIFKKNAKDVTDEAIEKTASTTVNNTFEKTASEIIEDTINTNIEHVTGDVISKTGEILTKPKNKVGLLSKIIDKTRNAINKLFKNSKVYNKLIKVAKTLGVSKPSKWIKTFQSQFDDIITKALEKGIGKVGSETVKAIAGKLLSIAFLIKDFLYGCDNAESILGVSETSIVEELVAGLINAICEFTIILPIFPGTNKIAESIFNFINKDFKLRQDEATKEYEEYIKISGSTETKEEYLSRNYSFTGKISNWWKKDLENSAVGRVFKNSIYVLNPAKYAYNNISNLSKTIKDKNSSSVSSKINGISSIFSNAKGTESINKHNRLNPINLFSSLNIFNNESFYNLINKSKSSIKSLLNKTQEGKISILSKDYWKDSINNNDNSLASSIIKASTNIIKLINLPVFMIKNAMDTLSGNVINMVSSVSGSKITKTSTNNIKNNTYAATFTKSTKPKTFLGKVKHNVGVKGAIGGVKKLFGFGTSYNYGTGEYSKQIDPSVSNIRFNTNYDTEYQTIGNSGCGPAAAVNVIESMYGRGHEVLKAAKFALNHGYKETNGGTKPGFFTDYFRSKGYSSNTSYNRNQIERNINNGMPTVIMGKDPKGVSSSTPFGKTPHYVTVTGTDGKGNAIVQDPESKYDNQLYPVKKLMKNTSLGVSAFGKRFGRGKWGRGKNTIIFIGDSRGEMMKGAVEGLMGKEEANKHIWAVKGAMGYEWMVSTGVPSIESKINENTAVVIMMGVNDLLHPDWYTKYADYINGKADEWVSKGADVYYVSVNPVGPGKGYTTKWGSITNETVDTWNTNIKPKLSNKVRYMDLNAKLHGKFHTIDGVHYSWNVSKIIYQEIVKITSGAEPLPTSVSKSKSNTFNNTSNNTSNNTNNNSILNLFSSTLENSKAGKVMTSMIGVESKSGTGKFGRSKWGRGTEEQIWWYLKNMGMTDAGAAGFMGNLEAESGLNPINLEDQLEGRIGYTDETYTKAVDSGEIDRYNFVHPLGRKFGYGLAQWTWPSRKQNFYDFMKSKNLSIGDLGGQLDWLNKELNNDYAGVFNVLKTSNSLSETSNKVLHDFENPSNASSHEPTRLKYTTEYFNKHKGTTGEAIDGSTPTNTGSLSNSTTTDNSSNNSSNQNTGLLSLFTKMISESKAGRALNSLLGLTSNNTQSSTVDLNSNSTSSSYTGIGGDPGKVVSIAKQEVGTKEIPVNKVKYNDWYWGPGTSGDAYPWCAAWVSWVANQAGIPTNIIPKDAYTVTAYQKLISNGGQISNSEAKPGDIIYFTRNQKPSGIYHTGIITDNTGGTISTVEGNTNNGEVNTHTYDVSNPKVLCARPQYTDKGENNSSSNNIINTNNKAVEDVPDYANTRGNNGYKPLSKFGRFNDSINGRGCGEINIRHRSKEGYSIVAKSTVDDQLGKAMESYKRKHVYSTPRVGKGTSIDYTRFITNIIDILITIADNTDKLNLIISILNNKLNANITSNDISNATSNKQSLRSKLADTIKNNSYKFNNPNMDNSMNSIITAMNAIACE